MPDVILLGTGEGASYAGVLDDFFDKTGEEVELYRVMCKDEYLSIVEAGNKFVEHEYSMGGKWFATSHSDAEKWGRLFYQNQDYCILEITVLTDALKYMFHLRMLDNIGPAYSADVLLLNKIVRRVRLHEKGGESKN